MTFRHHAARCISFLLLAAALPGCATREDGRGRPGPLDPQSQTVMGNYEAIASCVAEAAEKSAGAAPTVRIDRPAKTARLTRMNDALTAVQYDITFAQVGVATVQVEGRGAPVTGGARTFELLWPQVGLCATNLTAP